jgi:pyruvate,water dikinase
VLRDIAEADTLQKGEILVAPMTSPPWTILFGRAAAVITDSGGVTSHPSVAAREYGIPCVVGTAVATQRIRDGMLLTVDGAQGTVRIDSE